MKAVWLLPCIRWPGCYCQELANHAAVRSPWDLGPVCCAKTASAQVAQSLRVQCVPSSWLEHGPSPGCGGIWREIHSAQGRVLLSLNSGDTDEQAWPWPLQNPSGVVRTLQKLVPSEPGCAQKEEGTAPIKGGASLKKGPKVDVEVSEGRTRGVQRREPQVHSPLIKDHDQLEEQVVKAGVA